MSKPSDTSEDVFAISATYRYIWVAGFTWAFYDWIITLDQEIDLVWRRKSGAWQSKILYVFGRYYGLALITGNVIVFMQSNLSAKFCRVYFYLWGGTGLAHMSAQHAALLLRVYVMYQRSFKIMAISITLFVIQLVIMSTTYFINVRDHLLEFPPAPATGCSAVVQHPDLATAYWCTGLLFETYMCILALGSAHFHWRAAGTRPPNILIILIRDSLFWYLCLGGCLFLNALFSMTGTGVLPLVGIPAIQVIATVGGPRFLLNLRAAYFLSTRNAPATRTGIIHNAHYTENEGTVGTVGVFRPATYDANDEDDGRRGNEIGSIEMGTRANRDPEG